METKQIPDTLAASSSLRVIKIDPQRDSRWEAFVASTTAIPSTVYHPAWLRVAEVYGFKPVHLACEDVSGQLVGILPFFYRRGWRSGGKFVSVFTGPLAHDDQAMATLIQAAIERTRTEPGAQLHLKVISNAFDGLVDGVVGVPIYKTYMLALPERPDLLRLDSAIKRAINKATRSGVQVRQAQTERELRTWYELYVHTMRKLAVMPNSYRYYKLAWRQLYPKGMLRLLLAEHIEAGQRKLLGGILILLDGRTVSFISAGWQEGEQALRPNDILHWQAIQDACADGLRWYDFGDVELENEGLARYKSKWGTEAKLVYDYSYPPAPDGIKSTHDKASNPVYQFVRAAWPHLPIKVIALLSSWYDALHLS